MTMIRRERKEGLSDDGHIKTIKKRRKICILKRPNEPMGLPAAISELTAFLVLDKRLNSGNSKGRRHE